MAKAKSSVPAGHHTATPHLIMNDAASALDWYAKALGAEELSRSRRTGWQDHARRDSRRQFDHHAQRRDGRRQEREGARRLADLVVALRRRLRRAFKRAIAAGATVPPGPMGQTADQFWGDRCGSITDPEGYSWTIATRKEDLTPEELDQRAQEFFKSFAARRSRPVRPRRAAAGGAAVPRFFSVVLRKAYGLLQILEFHRRGGPFGPGRDWTSAERIAWIETFSSVNG